MSAPSSVDYSDKNRGVKRRIIWVLLVAFVFSVTANIVLAVFLSISQKNRISTDSHQSTQATPRNGSARAGKASGEPAENSYWGKLEIARTAAMTVDYKGFRVLLYQTRSDPKLYYFVPAMILRSSSVKSIHNNLLARYQLEFSLKMYDDAFISHLKSEVNRLIKIRAELRVIPMEEVRIEAAAALLPDYEVDNNWKPYTRHPSEMSFRIFCATENACLAAKDYAVRFPQDFVSNLNVQISLQSQVSNSRRITISAEHISTSKLFTELNQRMKGKDEVYLATDDVKKLEQEVAQNLMAAEVTDAEFVSQESSPTLMGLIDAALHMTQASSEGFDKHKWNSVFWQDENARPDKVTSMVNEAYERLDSETRDMIKNTASSTSSQNLCVNLSANKAPAEAPAQGVTEADGTADVTKGPAATNKAPAATAKPGKRSVSDVGVLEAMSLGAGNRLRRRGRQASTAPETTVTSAPVDQTSTALSTVDTGNGSVNGSSEHDEEAVKDQDTLKLIFGLMVLQTVNPDTYADLMGIVRLDPRMQRECSSQSRDTSPTGETTEVSSVSASLDTCDLFIAQRLVEVTQEIAAASTLGQAVATSIGSTQEQQDNTAATVSAINDPHISALAAVDSANHDISRLDPAHAMGAHSRTRRGILSALGSIGNVISGAIGNKPGVGGIVSGLGNILKPVVGSNPMIQNIASSVGQFLNVNPAGTGSNPLNTIMQSAISGIGQNVDPFISSLMNQAASSIAQGKNPSISSLIQGLAGQGDSAAIKGLIQNAASSIGKGSDAFINTFLQNAASSISQGINPTIESLARNAAASLGQAANSSINSMIQDAASSLEKIQTDDPFIKSLFQSAAASIGKGQPVSINSLIENTASAIGKVNNSAQSLIQHAASNFAKGINPFVNSLIQNAATALVQGKDLSINSLIQNAATAIGNGKNLANSGTIQNAISAIGSLFNQKPSGAGTLPGLNTGALDGLASALGNTNLNLGSLGNAFNSLIDNIKKPGGNGSESSGLLGSMASAFKNIFKPQKSGGDNATDAANNTDSANTSAPGFDKLNLGYCNDKTASSTDSKEKESWNKLMQEKHDVVKWKGEKFEPKELSLKRTNLAQMTSTTNVRTQQVRISTASAVMKTNINVVPAENNNADDHQTENQLETYFVRSNLSRIGFSYEDAGGVCSELESRLALMDNLKKAYLKGAEWCFSGHLQDRVLAYPGRRCNRLPARDAPAQRTAVKCQKDIHLVPAQVTQIIYPKTTTVIAVAVCHGPKPPKDSIFLYKGNDLLVGHFNATHYSMYGDTASIYVY